MASWFNWASPGTGTDLKPAPIGTQPQLPQGTRIASTPLPGPGVTGGGGPFSVGEVVEYYSTSQGGWILATVLNLSASGNFDLDCKPDVPPEKIRRRAVQPGATSVPGAEHKAGDVVEYFSASQGGWIPAKVVRVNPTGTIDLDCKPDVTSDKIRRPATAGSGAGTVGGNTGNGVVGGSLAGRSGIVTLPTLSSSTYPSSPKGSPKRKLSGGYSKNIELDAPVQLLRVKRSGGRWQYEVCKEGADVLEQHGARRIAVASICGLYRTGKSYLLNMLLERVQRGHPLFRVGGTSQACTEGLWLWGSADSSDEQSPLLAFIDCEGFGSTDSDRTRDAQLMTLCTLISSVLVLNTKGALNESLFGALALTCRFAEHIEERGQEASRPVLLWVLRDFMLELRDENGRPITPDEYLEKSLHATSQAGVDRERGEAAREVRQSLLKFFSHRSCATLVQPAIEESQLQRLESIPYTSLRGEFRAGVEALRTQLVATCHSNPKTIGGQPLGCYSFVALLRQLVEALNNNKALSTKGAWDTVQHSACGNLADELRSAASQTLRALATGQKLQGGAQLPMTSDALHTVLRDQRRALKSQWVERAVGDEAVRKEYWQELKDSLEEEETSVWQQNTRLADQQLKEVIERWQEWLDDDNGATSTGEQISKDFGRLWDRMPSAPLSRAGRAAIEAAARRISVARTSMTAAVDQSKQAQAKAVAFGEQASQMAGATRAELEAHHADLQETQEQLKVIHQSHQSKQFELEAQQQEHENAKADLRASLQDLEDTRARCNDMASHQKTQEERHASLRNELEQVRSGAAKADAERLASEKCADAAAKVAESERQRLETALRQVREEKEQNAKKLAAEREAHRGEAEKTKEYHSKLVDDVRRQLDQERSTLRVEHEKTRDEHGRMLEDVRKLLDEERRGNTKHLETAKAQLLETERAAGVLEGQVHTLSAEATTLRERIAELQETIREAEARSGHEAMQNERLRQEVERAKADHKAVEADNSDRISAKAREYESIFQERFMPQDGPDIATKPKCGCSVQ